MEVILFPGYMCFQKKIVLLNALLLNKVLKDIKNNFSNNFNYLIYLKILFLLIMPFLSGLNA